MAGQFCLWFRLPRKPRVLWHAAQICDMGDGFTSPPRKACRGFFRPKNPTASVNFFDHKDLGNHLLQLCPKVVKHPVYPSKRRWLFTNIYGVTFQNSLITTIPPWEPQISRLKFYCYRRSYRAHVIDWATYRQFLLLSHASCLCLSSVLTVCCVQITEGARWPWGLLAFYEAAQAQLCVAGYAQRKLLHNALVKSGMYL